MRAAVVFAAVVAACPACGSSAASSDASESFIAFNPTFAPFRTWTTFSDDLMDPNNTLPVGVAGPRDQFINMLPPTGSTEFPVGTVIVEVRTDTGKIFASVKRGGNFNAAGDKNWEYFELQENPVTYLWRGLGPPLGDTYGGDPNGCNQCHSQCAANDYVCSPKLQLTGF